MKLLLLTFLTLLAFAGNSLLNRAGLLSSDIGPDAFGFIRLASGALALLMLLTLRDRTFVLRRPNLGAVLSLCLYIFGFSFAYVALDAGVGALLLFGAVQITMFCLAWARGQKAGASQWAGMALSLVGLAMLSWPGADTSLPTVAMGLMVAAGIGWGIYSAMGVSTGDPLQATAWNFAYAAVLSGGLLFVFADIADIEVPKITATNADGYIFATLSGVVTSGLGYALWYQILPRLGVLRASLSQLLVPVLTMILGAYLLGEALTLHAALSAGLVTGGVAIGVLARARA